MIYPINVYAPNLRQRSDRRASIYEQFSGKDEFDFHLVEAIEQKNAPWGLWQTFYRIVELERGKGSPYFIFCEDDHVFTKAYSREFLLERIAEADRLEADLLSGGMSVIKFPVQVSPCLFWVGGFNGMQFMVIFNRLYGKILSSKTDEGYVTDIHLSYIAKTKLVMYPYISVQKEFGYSDTTYLNNESGRVTRFFENTQVLLEKLEKCRRFYGSLPEDVFSSVICADVENCFIPTYVINLKDREDRLASVMRQFRDRLEFDIHVFEACSHPCGAVGLWQSICSIVRQAMDAGEDYVLICEDDHVFTDSYEKEKFMKQILLAGTMGAQLLAGGVGGFGNLVPLRMGLYWCDWFWCTQFIVVYRSAFTPILSAEFSVRDVADGKLSELLTNKMVIAPFISEQTDFGYSDITDANNDSSLILRHFDDSRHCLENYEFVDKRLMHGDKTFKLETSVDSYILRDGSHSLHLGCGQNLIEGWLNTDLKPVYGATFLDVTQNFPIPDRSLDNIFMEHLLELFPAQKVLHVLMECRRALKSGGILRITMFSQERLACHFLSVVPDKDWDVYCSWNLAHYSAYVSPELAMGNRNLCNSIVLSNFSHKMSEGFFYDFESMRYLLEFAGFVNVVRQDIGESPHPELCGLERFVPYMPKETYKFETLTIEAEVK